MRVFFIFISYFVPCFVGHCEAIFGEVAELVEGARLESVYTSKGYRGFESHPLRLHFLKTNVNLHK